MILDIHVHCAVYETLHIQYRMNIYTIQYKNMYNTVQTPIIQYEYYTIQYENIYDTVQTPIIQ